MALILIMNSIINVVSQWSLDAVLMSSNALLKRFQLKDGELNEETDFKIDDTNENDNKPLLIVPDNRGRIRIWDKILKTSFYRDILVLCSRSTPQEYLDFLEESIYKIYGNRLR